MPTPGAPLARVTLESAPGIPALLPAATLRALVRRALGAAGAPAGAVVGVILADDARLAELNAVHMGKDGPTDVLSFPLLPPSAFPAHAGQDPALRAAGPADGFVLPPGLPVHLGEIVVSVERAIAQATGGTGGQTGDRGGDPADELRLLLVHGVLHLCGWDHADAGEETAMRALERAILTGGHGAP
ncbi:MAG: rRNA maturation RNase YbeY [Chloroflexota bacterium]